MAGALKNFRTVIRFVFYKTIQLFLELADMWNT